jgi:group II intron reverse transcriptase/maturase
VSLERAVHQKPGGPGRNAAGRGEAALEAMRDEARTARHATGSPGRDGLLAQALASANMLAAWKRVKANRGSAGVDGLSIAETADYLRTHWPRIWASCLDGSYRHLPVRRVQIPKPDGGVRELGIPTVADRLIQQALLQVLQRIIDPTFSEHSYGFRPGRCAHDAVLDAQRFVQDGYRVVVDVDLEKFFDRVNHDILMERLARRTDDMAVLRLIRRYLAAGIMDGGVVMERYEGTPQGGPLSPLLANVLLDDVNRELERRGHRFVRYADDCNVYVRSQKAGRSSAGWPTRRSRPSSNASRNSLVARAGAT